MRLDAEKLPDNANELKSIIIGLEEKEERYLSRIEYLEERVRLLTKELFGRKTEKRPGESELRQLHLFNEAEVFASDEKNEKAIEVPAHIRQRPKRKPLPANLPRVDEIHDLTEEQKVCPCGARKKCIGQEVSEKLDYVPAKVRVIRQIRLKYACDTCEGVESEEPTVQIAPVPPQLIPKGIATPGLISHIAISKYCDALPLYRQEKIFARLGIELSRSTMASWMVKVAEQCQPLMILLGRELLTGPVVNADETPLQVLNEPGKKNTTLSYMWVFRGGNPEKPVVLFHYSPTRSGEIARQILQGYTGYVQCDAFSGYDILEKDGMLLVGCFSHTRRNFVKVIDARGKDAKNKPGSAEVALEYIRKLYVIEDVVRQEDLPSENLLALRKEKAIPVLEEFKGWMNKRFPQTPPKGLLGKALDYALTNWPRLVRYLDDLHLTPDNNIVENDIRPFALGRKNWLFAGHPNGAVASATLFTLIETSKACGLDPYWYLRFLFEMLPHAHTEDDFKALLPQYVSKEQISRFMPAL
jgi:transposase